MDRTIRSACLVIGLAWLTTAGTATAQSPPIKIGYSMSLSGGLAAGGRQAALVYDMWAEDVNEHGGLLGRKIAMIKYDDQSTPSTIPGIYSKLLDVDRVDLVLCGNCRRRSARALPSALRLRRDADPRSGG